VTSRAKKYLYLAVGILISVILIWTLFRNTDVTELWKALKNADYIWLVPNMAFIVLTMYQRAYRWRLMVLPIAPKVPFSKLLAATCIGFMANNVLPLRLGEFVRAYSLSAQQPGITKSASLATIFVERMVFDLVALLLIFGSVLYVSPLVLDQSMRFGLNFAIIFALCGLVFIVVLALRPAQAGKLLAKYLFFLPVRGKEFVQTVVVKFSHGLDFLSNGKTVFWVAVHTLLIWIFMGYSNYFIFKAFGLNLTYDACYVLLVVVSISILVPSTPGFVGVFHAGAVWSLMTYGVGKEEALSCALVLHAAQYIVVTVMGFYFLKKKHLSLRKLEEEVEDGDES